MIDESGTSIPSGMRGCQMDMYDARTDERNRKLREHASTRPRLRHRAVEGLKGDGKW
ncbi:MAG: hypothetical protein ACP5NO_08515 [Thermoplasmata archaeon]